MAKAIQIYPAWNLNDWTSTKTDDDMHINKNNELQFSTTSWGSGTSIWRSNIFTRTFENGDTLQVILKSNDDGWHFKIYISDDAVDWTLYGKWNSSQYTTDPNKYYTAIIPLIFSTSKKVKIEFYSFAQNGTLTQYVKSISYIPNSKMSTIFTFTNSVQKYIVPTTGLYKLSVWGAKGGDIDGRNSGRGGYSTGEVPLRKGTVLYVACGGAGENGTAVYNHENPELNSKIRLGGFNGGGNGQSREHSGGGGASHIALVDGTLSEIGVTLAKNKVLIVAGGAGGAHSENEAGYGGGLSGQDAHDGGARGGTQTSGGYGGKGPGYFGQGGGDIKPYNPGLSYFCGGGGGWYGGGSAAGSAGAGGSGYVSTQLTNANTYVGGITWSFEDVNGAAIIEQLSSYHKVFYQNNNPLKYYLGQKPVTYIYLGEELIYPYGDIPEFPGLPDIYGAYDAVHEGFYSMGGTVYNWNTDYIYSNDRTLTKLDSHVEGWNTNYTDTQEVERTVDFHIRLGDYSKVTVTYGFHVYLSDGDLVESIVTAGGETIDLATGNYSRTKNSYDKSKPGWVEASHYGYTSASFPITVTRTYTRDVDGTLYTHVRGYRYNVDESYYGYPVDGWVQGNTMIVSAVFEK